MLNKLGSPVALVAAAPVFAQLAPRASMLPDSGGAYAIGAAGLFVIATSAHHG